MVGDGRLPPEADKLPADTFQCGHAIRNLRSEGWSGMADSNCRPQDPQPCALPTTLIPERQNKNTRIRYF